VINTVSFLDRRDPHFTQVFQNLENSYTSAKYGTAKDYQKDFELIMKKLYDQKISKVEQVKPKISKVW
jgi:hypothetical protein